VPELVYRATALSRQASRWAERYHTALRRATDVRILARSHTMPGWLATRPDYDTWQRSNRWVLHYAWAASTTGRVTVLALWNGQVGDGRGGVSDMIDMALNRGADVITLDSVGLFGLPEAPADRPVDAAAAPSEVADFTPTAVTERPTAVPAAADQVGPLGGAVSTLPSVAESPNSRVDAARDAAAPDC
jgi:hypothetical protein